MSPGTVILMILALGGAVFYGIILFLDWQGRKKLQQEEQESSTEAPFFTERNATSIVYPPGFEFLREQEVSTDPPANLDEEVQKLVRTFEDQTTEVYRRFHRLLQYSDKVTKTEEESEKTKLQFQDDLGRLAEENRNLQEINSSQQISLNELQERVGKLQEKYDRKRSEMEEMHLQFEEDKKGFTKAREDLEADAHGSEEKINALESEKEGLVKELEATRNRCAELESTVEELRAAQEEWSESKANESVTKVLYAENKELSERCEQAEKELEQARAELQEVQEYKDAQHDAKQEIEQAVQTETVLLEQEISRLKAELEETRAGGGAESETHGLSETVPADTEEIDELQRKIIKRDNDIAQLNEIIEDLKRNTTSVSREREDEVAFLHDEIKKKEQAIEEERNTSAGLNEQIHRLQSALEEGQTKAGTIEEQNKELELRIQNLLGAEDSVQIEMGALEEKLSSKEKDIKDLNAHIQTLEKKLEQKHKEYEDTVSLLEHKMNERDMEELETEKEKQNYDRKITDREEKIQGLEAQVAELENEREDWHREADFLRDKISTLEKNLKEERQEASEAGKLEEENEKYADKILQLNEQIIDKEEENDSLREKLVTAEELVQGLKGRIALLENEVRERTISEKEHITCSKCFKDIPADDITLKKAQRIDGKIFCKFCLEEMEHEARELVIEDRLEKLASLVSELRLRQDWSEYRELDICEELVALGKKHVDVLAQIREGEQDEYVRDTLGKVIDMIKSGESPQDVLIDDDLEKTAYLLQKLREFPGNPAEGKGREICRQLVTMGPSIEILLRGIISQEKDPGVRNAIKQVKTAIETGASFDDVS